MRPIAFIGWFAVHNEICVDQKHPPELHRRYVLSAKCPSIREGAIGRGNRASRKVLLDLLHESPCKIETQPYVFDATTPQLLQRVPVRGGTTHRLQPPAESFLACATQVPDENDLDFTGATLIGHSLGWRS
jgi:hypothetical protein